MFDVGPTRKVSIPAPIQKLNSGPETSTMSQAVSLSLSLSPSLPPFLYLRDFPVGEAPHYLSVSLSPPVDRGACYTDRQSS